MSNNFTILELKHFATEEKIFGRSKIKNKSELLGLIKSHGDVGSDIEKAVNPNKKETLVEFVKNDQSQYLENYYEKLDALIEEEFGKLPFAFSGDWLLQRLDEPIEFEENRVEIIDERNNGSPKIILRNLQNRSVSPRDIIMIMKEMPYYKGMTELAGDHQFLASFTRIKKGVYEAIFDS